MGWEVAAALGAPLDVFAVRKLGVPQRPELAMGAIASGAAVVNERVVAGVGIGDAQLQDAQVREAAELARREVAYRGGRKPLDVSASTVLLVDDGVATGASMRVALQAIRALAPRRLAVAIPVGPPDVRAILADADEVYCAVIPRRFEAVGQAYADFRQVDDDEVRELLHTPTR